MRTLSLDVAGDEAVGFILCLALGTLRAIEQGSISPDVGIWGLGRPKLLSALEELGTVPPELRWVLQSADELSPRDGAPVDPADPFLNDLIARVERALRERAAPAWSVDVAIRG